MTNVLMCGSALSIKGGMVSVVNNYLNYKDWKDVKISYIPTHINAHKYKLEKTFIKYRITSIGNGSHSKGNINC